ncbi:hypothetical protein P7C70_g8383, partial [Phenoliferia sp. Uapishka_3]
MTSTTVTPHAKIEAVLFDMDGLMIDRVLEPWGKTMTWDIKRDLMGRPGVRKLSPSRVCAKDSQFDQIASQHDAARCLIEATGIDITPEEFMSRMQKRLNEVFQTVQPLPGVVKLVHHLKKHNIPIAFEPQIATGSKTDNYQIKTKHLGHLFEPFGANVLCGDDPRLEGKGKPDPTIFIEAAKLLGITTPEGRAKCLVFEDGAPGVRAGRAAGMEVVWIPDEELIKVMGDGHDLHEVHTHTTMDHFVPEKWGLPPY